MKNENFNLKIKNCIFMVLGGSIMAFGLCNVHSFSGVTEGGVLGLTLLLDVFFFVSPAISGFILNCVCYFLGYKLLGSKFIGYSIFGGGGFSLTYWICEKFSPIWPNIVNYPLIAAVVGALFVGVGAGICVKMGGAPVGDDALAMSLNRITHMKIQWCYLISDLVVLGLSLSYIPIGKIIYSLFTVILSGQIIGIVQDIGVKSQSI